MAPKRSEFVDYLLDQLQPRESFLAKSMFGGWGLYRHGRMFAIVADDALYLKVDGQTRPDFEALGLEPFTYQRKGKPFAMSYYQAPAEALDDPETLNEWVTVACGAADRAAQSK